MSPLPKAIRFFYLPLTPLVWGAYLLWAGWVLDVPVEVWSILGVFLFGFFSWSKSVYLGERSLTIEPLTGILFLGILRRKIDYHDILRVRFHRYPFPLGALFDQIDLVTPKGTWKLFRIAGRRTWDLQRQLMIRLPGKITWRPAPPAHVNARYDL